MEIFVEVETYRREAVILHDSWQFVCNTFSNGYDVYFRKVHKRLPEILFVKPDGHRGAQGASVVDMHDSCYALIVSEHLKINWIWGPEDREYVYCVLKYLVERGLIKEELFDAIDTNYDWRYDE